MSNGFEKPQDNYQKEVTGVNPKFLRILFAYSELKKLGKSETEAVEGADKFEIDEVAYAVWLKEREEKEKTLPVRKSELGRRFHTDEEIREYQNRHPEHYA